MTKKQNIPERQLDPRRIECMDDAMVAVYKKKSPEERIKIVSEMYESARLQISDFVRHHHPDWSSQQIQKEVIKRLANEK